MNTSVKELGDLVGREYKEGFVTDIESDTLPPGLDESVVRFFVRQQIRTPVRIGLETGRLSSLAGDGSARLGPRALCAN